MKKTLAPILTIFLVTTLHIAASASQISETQLDAHISSLKQMLHDTDNKLCDMYVRQAQYVSKEQNSFWFQDHFDSAHLRFSDLDHLKDLLQILSFELSHKDQIAFLYVSAMVRLKIRKISEQLDPSISLLKETFQKWSQQTSTDVYKDLSEMIEEDTAFYELLKTIDNDLSLPFPKNKP